MFLTTFKKRKGKRRKEKGDRLEKKKRKGGQTRKKKKKLTDLKNNTIFNTNKQQTKKDHKVSLKTGKSKKMRILSRGNEHGKSKTTLGLTGCRILSYHLEGGSGRTPI